MRPRAAGPGPAVEVERWHGGDNQKTSLTQSIITQITHLSICASLLFASA